MWISNIYINNLHQTYITHTHYLPGGGRRGGGCLHFLLLWLLTFIKSYFSLRQAVWGRYIRELIYFKTT